MIFRRNILMFVWLHLYPCNSKAIIVIDVLYFQEVQKQQIIVCRFSRFFSCYLSIDNKVGKFRVALLLKIFIKSYLSSTSKQILRLDLDWAENLKFHIYMFFYVSAAPMLVIFARPTGFLSFKIPIYYNRDDFFQWRKYSLW